MIVFDENIHQQRLMDTVASWYRGRVVAITALRPDTLIKDEAIPMLLRRASYPTFVTTNVDDFWRHVSADLRYSIVCASLSSALLHELPELLRRLLRLPEFRTKAQRMGKVIRISLGQVHYYERHTGQVRHLRTWVS